jgi:hypothetical protein
MENEVNITVFPRAQPRLADISEEHITLILESLKE